MRSCCGCKEKKPKKELIRVVRSPEGEISFDITGRKAGRGAYICSSKTCLAKAISLGVSKINVNTEFQQAWTALVREALAKKPNEYDPRKVIGPGLKGIEEVVVEKCTVFGCIGKA